MRRCWNLNELGVIPLAIDKNMSNWYVYILQCADNSLYTGVTTELSRRLSEHNKKTASRYTRSRVPVQLRYFECRKNRAEAQRREYEIKQFSRVRKWQLIAQFIPPEDY